MARLLRCGGAQSLVALVALVAAIGLSRADGTQGHLMDEEQWQRRKILTEFSLGPAPYTHQAQSGYELFADAYFRPDHIEVTKAEQHQTGAVWSKKRLEPTQSWQVDMTFRVGMWERDLFGDGFAFWYALDRGVGGVAMGGPTRFTGLAVFFDTYKNKEFRGKKHPYVYALVNNGTKEYDKIKVGDFPEGCHIPFRDATKFMETMARVTFLDGTLSVVMRPLGSMDWVRCFEIKNVKLPNYGFFGVTAMTGELVDHHQMIEMRVYNDVRTDPWTYAVPNDPSQMPDMWHAMLHSGELAREYSKWEQKIIEETEFDPEERADPYNDPYKEEAEEGAAADEAYRQETEEQQQRDKEPEPEEHSGSGDSGSRSNMIREKRAKYEARKRGERGVKVDDPRTSLAELESIEEELAALGPLQNYYERVQNENRDKIAKLRQHMEAEVNEISTRLTTMLRDIRFKEHALTQRIYQLADRLNVDIVRPLEAEHEESKRGWLLPFLVFLSLCGAVALLGYSRYRHFMKTHLL